MRVSRNSFVANTLSVAGESGRPSDCKMPKKPYFLVFSFSSKERISRIVLMLMSRKVEVTKSEMASGLSLQSAKTQYLKSTTALGVVMRVN